MPDWTEFRRQMPVAERWAYFDHAAVAPLCTPAAQALSDWAHEIAQHGDATGRDVRQRIDQARKSAARLLGTQADEVAFLPNTSTGLSLIAESFPWQPGDNVVVPVSEFPSNIVPWRNLVSRGVEVRGVPAERERLTADELLAAADEHTRILTVSWVGFATGWRQNLDELAEKCRRRGILLCVDAIQGLGVIPLDVTTTPIDFLAADGHKWLLGPEGAGVLFVRREHLNRLRPLVLGWNSLASAGNYNRSAFFASDTPEQPTRPFCLADPIGPAELRTSAARFEPGSLNVGGVLALGESIDFLLSFGVSAIWSRLREVTQELRELLRTFGAQFVSSDDEQCCSGIVSCDFPGRSTEAFRQRCLPLGVVLNRRGGFVRLSPHAYTNGDDWDRLRSALASLTK